jgi:hypothetical protein
MSTCPDPHLTPWVESRFNTACDVLERILNEIARDDSGAKDCKSEALTFPKFAELESLYERMCSGSDKEQIRSLCRGLRYKVINFLHYQKLICFRGREWNDAFKESSEFWRYPRFVPLAKKFEEICNQNGVYVSEEVERIESRISRLKFENYIKKEDEYLTRIQGEFARAYHDESDKQMITDFEETEKALKCRRLQILYHLNSDPKFKKCFHELWPFMKKHNLWNFPTPSQYKNHQNGLGQYMVCMPLQTTFSPENGGSWRGARGRKKTTTPSMAATARRGPECLAPGIPGVQR